MVLAEFDADPLAPPVDEPDPPPNGALGSGASGASEPNGRSGEVGIGTDIDGMTVVTGTIVQVQEPFPAICSSVATDSAVAWAGLSIGLNGLMIAGVVGVGLLTLGVVGPFGVPGLTPGFGMVGVVGPPGVTTGPPGVRAETDRLELLSQSARWGRLGWTDQRSVHLGCLDQSGSSEPSGQLG